MRVVSVSKSESYHSAAGNIVERKGCKRVPGRRAGGKRKNRFRTSSMPTAISKERKPLQSKGVVMMMEQAIPEYQITEPYPPVCAERPNRVYAGAMLDNIGGCHSEMSTVSLYFYNHLMTHAREDVAKIFHDMSITEMHHLEIFGTLARQLGENPRLWSRRGEGKVYWSPGCNHYPTALRPMLVNAISGEKAAIRKYEAQAKFIRDANVVENLRRNIADERVHVAMLSQLLRRYCAGPQQKND